MTPKQAQILLNATGDGTGWRNRFLASRKTAIDCEALCAMGLMRIYCDGVHHVTHEGIIAAARLRWDVESANNRMCFLVARRRSGHVFWAHDVKSLWTALYRDMIDGCAATDTRDAARIAREEGVKIWKLSQKAWVARVIRRYAQ